MGFQLLICINFANPFRLVAIQEFQPPFLSSLLLRIQAA